jgi:hypothetical protein
MQIMDISTLRRGDPVELLIDANAIPAGCYRFLEHYGEMCVFTLGEEVIIGLAADFWTKFMRPARESGVRLTSEAYFAKAYSRLYRGLRRKRTIPDPTRLTFCFISPRMLRLGARGMKAEIYPFQASELFS